MRETSRRRMCSRSADPRCTAAPQAYRRLARNSPRLRTRPRSSARCASRPCHRRRAAHRVRATAPVEARFPATTRARSPAMASARSPVMASGSSTRRRSRSHLRALFVLVTRRLLRVAHARAAARAGRRTAIARAELADVRGARALLVGAATGMRVVTAEPLADLRRAIAGLQAERTRRPVGARRTRTLARVALLRARARCLERLAVAATVRA